MSIQHVLISSINFWYLRQLPVVETIAHKCTMHLPISVFSFCTSGNFIFFCLTCSKFTQELRIQAYGYFLFIF